VLFAGSTEEPPRGLHLGDDEASVSGSRTISRYSKGEIILNETQHEEMFNIPGHKGNANQNDIKISPHTNQNSNH
jgi:hypothetical protein